MANKVMMTFTYPGGTPTVQDVMRKYGLQAEEMDASFGVIEIDPEDHLYSMMIDSAAAERIQPGSGGELKGPFSNPRIEPFGLEQ